MSSQYNRIKRLYLAGSLNASGVMRMVPIFITQEEADEIVALER